MFFFLSLPVVFYLVFLAVLQPLNQTDKSTIADKQTKFINPTRHLMLEPATGQLGDS